LLREGTTVHRRFGPIPSPLKPDSAVFLDANDPRIELFYHADVIIIDECSGMHVVSFLNYYQKLKFYKLQDLLNYLNRLLNTYDQNFGGYNDLERPFAGKVIFF
jgi:hypothetical protein